MRIKTPCTIKPPTLARLNPTHPLTRGLAGCWLLNEGAGCIAYDVSGQHCDGIFAGGPVWSPGRFGYAVEFDGDDDWISMGDCLDLGVADVSMLAIVKYSAAAQPDQWSGLHVGAIAGKGHLDSAGRGYGLSVNNGNQVYWQVRNQNSNYFVVSDGALNDGQYHVAIGVCDRDNTMGVRLYVDGIQQATTADPTPIDGNDLSGARAFAIGSRQETGGTWFWDFAGTVAAVYVWKRVLTEAEVRQLQCAPYALFASRPTVACFASPAGTPVECSGLVIAQATMSAGIRVVQSISGSLHGIASTAVMAQVLRDILSTSAASTILTAFLTRTGLVQIAGTANATTAVNGALNRLAPQTSYNAMLGVKLCWLRETLWGGMTGTACKLGTMLTRGWFWMRRGGCTALYGGTTHGQVDFSRILQVIDTRSDTLSIYPSSPTGSTHYYLVRRFNSCGEQERTTAAATVVRITAEGRLAPPSPNALYGLKGEQIAGNKLRLTWFYCPLDQDTPPEQFNVYWDGGTAQIDLEHPIAIIPYGGRKFYRYDSDVLNDGRYMFIVQAVALDIMASMPPAGVVCHVENPSYQPVFILATQCI